MQILCFFLFYSRAAVSVVFFHLAVLFRFYRVLFLHHVFLSEHIKMMMMMMMMCSLIDHICSRSGYKLFLGDFNFPDINWNTWNTVGHLERKFIDTLQKKLFTTAYLLSNPCKRFRNPTFTRLNHNRRVIYRKH